MPASIEPRRAYWRANLKLLAVLLSIWFAVSFGAGILFVDELDGLRLGGFKLGFWFSQQGSIYVFVALVVVYVRKMNALDQTLLQTEAGGQPSSATNGSTSAPANGSSNGSTNEESGEGA